MAPHRQSAKAFTLAELLIALAILGVIATFTIPKVLSSQADQRTKARIKEAVGAISDITYTAVLQGQMDENTYTNYMYTHLNAVKICNTDASAQGCWPGSSSYGANTATAPGMVMHTGAMVTDICPNAGTCATAGDQIFIDGNGTDGPNQGGVDQLSVYVCYKTGCPNSLVPGQVGPNNATNAGHWAAIFGP